jgi:sirohydrochlorin cobaltochelatase
LKQGIVLFAHGSRDPEWARPFESLAAELSKKHVVRLAYLECMQPRLEDAIAALADVGVNLIRIVPIFLAQGGHVKEDLPRLVTAARKAHPNIDITLEKAIGERPQVLAAIARAISADS